MQIIIDTANTRITVKNKCFFIQNKSIKRQISPKRISSIAITTDCTLNAAAIKLAANHQVPILFFNNFGTIQARMWSPYFVNLAALRKKQLLFSQTSMATDWVIQILQKKSEAQLLTLQRLAKEMPRHQDRITAVSKQIRIVTAKLNTLKEKKIVVVRSELMGYEGTISRYYFQAINLFLPSIFQFKKRSRRPALDFYNAALNYLYGMTYSIVEGGVFAKGLDPSIGFLHVDGYNKPTLVFDLIEPIRPLIDRILLRLIRTNQLHPDHFIKKEQGFWIGKEGKRIIVSTFNDYLNTRIEVDNTVRRLKDHVYAASNDLGNLIEQSINE